MGKGKNKSTKNAGEKTVGIPARLRHNARDVEMMNRVRELAAKPQNLETYSEICDAAYKAFQDFEYGCLSWETCDFRARRTWVSGLVFLLLSPAVDDARGTVRRAGCTLEDANRITACFSRIILPLRAFATSPYSDYPNTLSEIYRIIEKEKVDRAANGRDFSLFETLFVKDVDVPDLYRFNLFIEGGERRLSLAPLRLEEIVGGRDCDIEAFLKKEDESLAEFAAAWLLEVPLRDEARKMMYATNRALKLNTVVVANVCNFVASYKTETPMELTEKIAHDFVRLCCFIPEMPYASRYYDGRSTVTCAAPLDNYAPGRCANSWRRKR